MQQPKQIDLNKKPLLKLYYNFLYWLQSIFQRDKLFSKVAIHESGHIVFNYFYGFSVRQSKLIISKPGNGFTETEYGKEILTANIIMKNLISDFQRMKPETQQHICKTAMHLLIILYSGSASEVFINQKKTKSKYDLEISGEDLNDISIIENFFFKIGISLDINEIPKTTFFLLEKFPILKQSIETLSSHFLKSKDFSLSKNEIEKILNDINFFSVKNEIIDNHTTK